MTTFVLVHGGLHGSWCWEPVLEPLRAAGHQVDAIDLPGRPGGPEVSSIDIGSFVDVLTDAVNRAEEPVVVVAHSLGGVTAMLAAESRPQAISRIVFINAVLPCDGEGVLQTVIEGGPESVLLREGARVPAGDGLTIFVDSPATAIDAFYNRCDPDVAKQAASQLCPEPMPPLLAPVSVTATRFGSVPKTYIGAEDDHVVPWALQQRMSHTHSARLVKLNGDHSPFLSATDDLLTALVES